MTDPLLAAANLLTGDESTGGHLPFSAIGWDAERKVLSFRRHHDEWVNLWLEPPGGNGPVAEQNNGPAAGTVILWAHKARTFNVLGVREFEFLDGQLQKLGQAESLIAGFPKALLAAGADQVLEEAWAEKIAEYRDA